MPQSNPPPKLRANVVAVRSKPAKSSMTRYLRIRDTLAKEFAEGRYRVGQRFPTDQELRARFSVSRHTIREALRDLQQNGVLTRQRGAGTVVSAPSPPPYVQAVESLAELDNYAAETRFECMVESTVVARQRLARQLECSLGSRWLRFAGLRYRKEDRNPLCWTEVYLAEELIGDQDAIRRTTGPFFDRIRRIRGITANVVEQQVRAVAITKKHAGMLNYPEGAPALLVRRRYVSEDGAPFEITLSIHPADRYVSSTRLTRRRV
jgi:GntR family transcriptional regulator